MSLTMARATAVLMACALVGIAPAAGEDAIIPGVFALTDAPARVAGEMVVRDTGLLSREVEIVFTDPASGQPIQAFDEDLTQELHLLAVDESLTTLIHEHVRTAAPDGRFVAAISFPRPGLYHVYADAHPTGLGQQVLRFDIRLPGDDAASPPPASTATPHAPVAIASDGGYAVEIDIAGLEVGKSSPLPVTITADGRPANDLSPYLGVAAHALFIREEDLAYVHVHPRSDAGAAGHDDHGSHSGDAAATPPEAAHSDAGHQHDAAAPAEPDAVVSPEIVFDVVTPGPGSYALFLQFMGGAAVRTVSFALEVAADAHHH